MLHGPITRQHTDCFKTHKKLDLVQHSVRQGSLSAFVRECRVHLTYIRNVLVKCDHAHARTHTHTHINAFDRHVCIIIHHVVKMQHIFKNA